jgi:hypothetical protein
MAVDVQTMVHAEVGGALEPEPCTQDHARGALSAHRRADYSRGVNEPYGATKLF